MSARVDLDQARRFLALLDPECEKFTFQAIRDQPPKVAKDPVHLKPDNLASLAKLNADGYGVFYCPSETDLKGRKKENVVRARCVWLDLDGAPLEPIMAAELTPHAIVETSPGKYHVYWLTDELEPDQAEAVMRRMMKRLGGDPAATDRSRLLRVPGFWHQKKAEQPFQSRIVSLEEGLPYTPEQIEALCAPVEAHEQGNGRDGEFRGDDGHLDMRALVEALNGDRAGWHSAMIKVVGRMVADGYPDSLIGPAIMAYRWPEYSIEETKREIKASLAGARAKGYEKKREEANGPARFAPLDIIGNPMMTGWPELDETCLPAPLLTYARGEGARLNADPCAIALHCLAACSSSISDQWRIKPKKNDFWTQQARIWGCVVKPVGSRGTDMLKAAYFPVDRRDTAMQREHQAAMKLWKARQDAVAKKDRDPDDVEPRLKRLVTNDATIEKVGELLSNEEGLYGKLTYKADELIAFLGGFGRYKAGAADRAHWLETYDGGPHTVDRIVRGTCYAPNWSVVIAGNIQERRLAEVAGDLINDGLLQRFIVVHAKPPTLGLDDDITMDTGQGHDYCELLDILSELRPPKRSDDKISPAWLVDEAREVRVKLKKLIERLQHDITLPSLIREAASKWSGLFARLALIFHLVTIGEMQRRGVTLTDATKVQVQAETAAMAAAFIRKIVLPNLFRLALQTMPEEGAPATNARWIAEYILAHGKDHVTQTELGRANRRLRGKTSVIMEAMAVLVDAGWAERMDGRVDGARWSVSPEVHVRFAEAAAQEKERRTQVRELIRVKVEKL